MPKVTIAIPTRNRVGYLALSLQSALQQTLQDIEVVVSDNMCTDGTADLLATITDSRVRILRQTTDLTMVQNWNACVAAAAGEYFLLLSDDDLLEPRALEAMVQAFEAGPDAERVGMVYCRGHVIDAEGKVLNGGMGAPLQEEAPDLVVAFFNSKRETWPCAVLLRREDLGTGYSTDFLLITDAAAWIKAVCKRGCARFANEDLVNYRVHASLTNTTPPKVWQQDNSKVAEFAIHSLQQAGRSNRQLEKQIRQAVHRLNLRIAISLPLGAKDNRRRIVLGKYLEYLPQFTSWYGAVRMTRGILVVLLPKPLLQLLRTVKHRFDGSRRKSF